MVRNYGCNAAVRAPLLFAALLVLVSAGAFAEEGQDTASQDLQPQFSKQAADLDKVVVAVPLIPQTNVEASLRSPSSPPRASKHAVSST